jgi:peptide/nickel transport system permease protein
MSIDEQIPPTPMETGTSRPEVRHRYRKAWKRNSLGFIGITMVSIILLAAILGPPLLDIDPNAQDLSARLLPLMSQGPEEFHFLGTDNLGRDVLSRALTGARGSLGVAFLALILGGTIGVLMGMASGFYGKWVDQAVMRLTDAQLALPNLISAMFVSAVLGTGYWKTALTLALATWPIYARVMRAEILKIKEEDYMASAIGLGSTNRWLLGRHVLPNLVSSLLVIATLELGGMILTESSLSFLGFGIQPPDPSLGGMIGEGQVYVFSDARLSVVPGVFILVTALGLNLVGDWLRDVLDPHTKTD